MGGNALRQTYTVRKPRVEYETIQSTVVSRLRNASIVVEIIYSVPGKQDFGDLDLLVCASTSLLRHVIITEFKPNEIVTHGGSVISFDFESFQIDLIQVDYIPMAQFYFSYGDMGHIIGKMMSVCKLKFGHTGLWLHLTQDDNQEVVVVPNVELSNDPGAICEFLGLDYSIWCRHSFANQFEVFNWVMTSKYFNRDVFYYDDLRHMSRAHKRPMLLEFYNYIGISPYQQIHGHCLFQPNLQTHALHFFHKEAQVQQKLQDMEQKRELKNKFNGRMFLACGVAPKKVGEFIRRFQASIDTNFDEYLTNHSRDEIAQQVANFVHINQ